MLRALLTVMAAAVICIAAAQYKADTNLELLSGMSYQELKSYRRSLENTVLELGGELACKEKELAALDKELNRLEAEYHRLLEEREKLSERQAP